MKTPIPTRGYHQKLNNAIKAKYLDGSTEWYSSNKLDDAPF